MCGIAGFVGGFVPGLVQVMNGAQSHRGPDGQGTYEDADGGVALGHVRLAILDRSPAAAQPMSSADGRFTLIYNGEIYNFRELRHELANRGHRFFSSGDTEVLLRGLQEYGLSFVERLLTTRLVSHRQMHLQFRCRETLLRLPLKQMRKK